MSARKNSRLSITSHPCPFGVGHNITFMRRMSAAWYSLIAPAQQRIVSGKQFRLLPPARALLSAAMVSSRHFCWTVHFFYGDPSYLCDCLSWPAVQSRESARCRTICLLSVRRLQEYSIRQAWFFVSRWEEYEKKWVFLICTGTLHRPIAFWQESKSSPAFLCHTHCWQ